MFPKKMRHNQRSFVSLSNEHSPSGPCMFLHHLVGTPLFSRNQMSPKYASKETRPEGKTSRNFFCPRGLRFITRTFLSSVLCDTSSNADLRELTHCQKA